MYDRVLQLIQIMRMIPLYVWFTNQLFAA